jgi:4-amino-4-deoxy-L-arabinose transferase-like glycosyltransferase
VVILTALVAVVGWHGLTSIGPTTGFDVPAHIAYAEILDRGRLPVEADTYEYASPPAFHWLALRADDLLGAVGARLDPVVPDRAEPWLRVPWLLLVAASAWCLGAGRRRLGAGGLIAAGVWALAAVTTYVDRVPWSGGQLISLASACALVVLGWLLGRELWPYRPWLQVAAAAATAGLPIVVRLGVMFHPEALFAAIASLAVWLVLRAEPHGWRVRDGLVAGAVLGASALTRQTGAVVAVGLLAVALLAGRRRAVGFALAAGAACVAVAGAWWVHQIAVYGNPLQSNLEREGYMLENGQPLSFFVSFPVRDLVVHPYRERFANELLPKMHSDLWSDWFGGIQGFWGGAAAANRVLASTQSVLGLGADALLVGGIALLGGAAAVRLARHRGRTGDVVLGGIAVLTALTWLAFVATLVRFPQRDGDPIKSSYLLYLAPSLALAAVAAADWAWRRGRGWRIVLVAWCLLYAISYAAVLATAF